MKPGIIPAALLAVAAVLALTASIVALYAAMEGRNMETQGDSFFLRVNTSHLGEDIVKNTIEAKLREKLPGLFTKRGIYDNGLETRSLTVERTPFSLPGPVNDVVNTVTDTGKDVVNTVQDNAKPIVDDIKDGAGQALDKAKELGEKVVQGAKDLAKEALDWVKEMIQKGLSVLNELINAAMKKLRETLDIQDYYVVNTLALCKGKIDKEEHKPSNCTEPFNLKLIEGMFGDKLDKMSGINLFGFDVFQWLGGEIKEAFQKLDEKLDSLGDVAAYYFLSRAVFCFIFVLVAACVAPILVMCPSLQKAKMRWMAATAALGAAGVALFTLAIGNAIVQVAYSKAEKEMEEHGKAFNFTFDMSTLFLALIWTPFALQLLATGLAGVAWVCVKSANDKQLQQEEDGDMDQGMTDGGDPRTNSWGSGTTRAGSDYDDEKSPKARD